MIVAIYLLKEERESSDRGHCFWSVIVVCGLWWGSSWWWWWSSSQDPKLRILGRGFESHRGGLESGVTARGGKVPGQALVPQLNYPPRREDRIKSIYFGCVCVCVWRQSVK